MMDNNDPDKKVEGAESTEDEEIIELKEEASDISQDNEEIIDLLDDVDESDVGEIITLTEAMSDTPQEIEEIGEPIHITVDTSQGDESIIDLEGNLLEETSDFDDELGEEVAFDQDISDDFVDSLGMELGSKEDVSENFLDAEKVSDAQIEAALERVIKKMFYEKIDSILVEVTEKTVTRELEKLKSILLQDAAENEK